jgi:hypothetical protein
VTLIESGKVCADLRNGRRLRRWSNWLLFEGVELDGSPNAADKGKSLLWRSTFVAILTC